MQDAQDQWPKEELEFAKNELAKEYASVSLTLINLVVDFTATIIHPSEGRVKLMQMARKNLSR